MIGDSEQVSDCVTKLLFEIESKSIIPYFIDVYYNEVRDRFPKLCSGPKIFKRLSPYSNVVFLSHQIFR